MSILIQHWNNEYKVLVQQSDFPYAYLKHSIISIIILSRFCWQMYLKFCCIIYIHFSQFLLNNSLNLK